MSTVFFNLRIDEDLNEEIVKIAKEQGRSKNKQIEQILKEFVKKYHEQNKKIEINQNNNKNAVVNIDTKNEGKR